MGNEHAAHRAAESKGTPGPDRAIREGLYTWDDLEDDLRGRGRGRRLEPAGRRRPDLDALLYVGDDEDEDPDYPEDQQPEPHVLRKRFNGQWREVTGRLRVRHGGREPRGPVIRQLSSCP
jgi:hypothetical protein